ncbi:MAG: VWA domain-containing protein [Mariniblastus sp.]
MSAPPQRYVKLNRSKRSGAVAVYTAIMLVILLGMVAFAVEIGTMLNARATMQSAADSAALAGASVLSLGENQARDLAKEYAAYHDFQGKPVVLKDDQIKIGFFDESTQAFTEDTNGNAIKILAQSNAIGLVFGSLLGKNSFESAASAIAMAPSRDIVFVVDLSGSMNDDSEPVWATSTIDSQYTGTPEAGIGTQLAQELYTDMGYGTYPGTLNSIGFSLGVADNDYAYAELSKDNGPLGNDSVNANYRILPTDSEATRKIKTYRYIIETEIPLAMPGVLPTPNASNFSYWERYIDYVIRTSYVHSVPWDNGGGGGGNGGSNPPTGPQPPSVGSTTPVEISPFRQVAFSLRTVAQDTPVDRGWIPSLKKSSRRVYRFNNPNDYAYDSPDSSTRWQMLNKIGYRTYVQFMLDCGRDTKPDSQNYVPISVNSPHCPYHAETTDGGNFNFPPRTQPMHSVRRSLINAIQIVKERNQYVSDALKDRISIVTFDSLANGTVTLQPLTNNYVQAMQACTTLQASIDEGRTTATELGLLDAKSYIQPEKKGGSGRNNSNKVVILLTDGLPNDYDSSQADINTFMTENADGNFYGGGYYWLDSPIMQTKQMDTDGWQVYPVGIGAGTDYDFMDRMSRAGGTAKNGIGPRGSGNPADYEQTLKDTFEEIILEPRVNLVK